MGSGHKSQTEFAAAKSNLNAKPTFAVLCLVGMSSTPQTLGIISDTHGLLRPEAKEALYGSDLIIHAGDIGNLEIISELRAIAPLFVVRGNVDQGKWASEIPETEVIQFSDFSIYVLHDLQELDLDPEFAGFHAVISGHTHRAHEYRRGNVLFLNPGSAGPRRFDLPITVARLHVAKRPWNVELIRLLD
jgi:uncharacterized protein